MKKKGVAFIGVGDISGIYLENLTGKFQDEIEIVGLCDLIRSKAEQAAKKFNIKKIYADMYEAFQDDAVDIILNLTRPNEHYGVTKAAVLAGKSVYSEKPLATTLSDGQELLEMAQKHEVAVGGAPDTFLGAGIQTCKKIIDAGMIGEPIGFRASMINRGHESWHPGPEFYYQQGGGPMLDMGPYYVSALTHLLGSVASVSAITKKTFAQRLITSDPLKGKKIEVQVPTYYMGILQFVSGVTGELFTTFDCFEEEQSAMTIYGSKGTLRLPDPNTFDGPIYLLTANESSYKQMPLLFENKENSRGLGVVEMARNLGEKSRFRTDIRQTFHVLEVLSAFEQSSNASQPIDIMSKI